MTVPFKVRSTFEYSSTYEGDLSFAANEIISVIEDDDDEWYTGTLNGVTGTFPKNFVRIEHVDVPQPVPPARPVTQSKAVKEEEPKEDANEIADDFKATKENTASSEASIFPPSAKPVSIPNKENVPLKPTSASVESIPMPIANTQRKEDPYAIKKLFIGAGKSSYVPPVKPRDQSNVVHGYHDVVKNTEIVREHDFPKEDEASEPQMSLKERIQMLKRVEEEEAEKKAATLKKEEERQRAKAAHKFQHTASLADVIPEIPSQQAGNSLHEFKSRNLEPAAKMPRSSKDEDVDEMVSEKMANDLRNQEKNEESDAEEETKCQEVELEEENDDNDEKDDDDENDEDLKRRRLVERMAKISGGRNMFGMMGMATPFGAPNSDSTVKRIKSPKKSPITTTSEPKSPSYDQVSPSAPSATAAESSAPPVNAVPVIPPSAIPLPGMTQTVRSAPHELQNEHIEPEEHVAELKLPKTIPVPHYLQEDKPDNFYEEQPMIEDNQILETPKFDNILDDVGMDYLVDEEVSDRGGLVSPEAVVPMVPVKSQKIPPPPPHASGLSPEVSALVAEIPKLPAVPEVPELPGERPPVPQESSVPPTPVEVTAIPPTSNLLGLTGPPSAEAPEPPEGAKRYIPPPAPHGRRSVELPPESPDSVDLLSHTFTTRGTINDEEYELTYGEDPKPNSTTIKAKTFNHHPTHHVIEAPQRRSSINEELRRKSSTSRSGGYVAQNDFAEVSAELANIRSSSGWYIKNDVPLCLLQRVGADLIYEVDTHHIGKRLGRLMVYKDYYILYEDLSQLLIELQYDQSDPRETVSVIDLKVQKAPTARKDLLHEFAASQGSYALTLAESFEGKKYPGGVVNEIFAQFKKTAPSILQPVGPRAFGFLVFQGGLNSSTKYDDIKPGDIVTMKDAKFPAHKSLRALTQKPIVLGENDDTYSAVVAEYDSKKDKIKVIENDPSGGVRREGYRLGDIRSGHVKIFRFLDRKYIGW